MKNFKGLAAVIVLALAPVSALAQTGAAGDWELTMTTPRGDTAITLSLSQSGTNVAGDLASPMGTVPVSGTANGDLLALIAKIEGMGIELGFTGTITGDSISGNAKFGDFGEFPFSGKRSVKTAAAGVAAATVAGPITDLNGKWDIKLAIAGMGEIPATAVIKQEGERLTGTLSGPAGDLIIAGTVTGTTVKIDFEAETPQGKLPVTMTGDMGATAVSGKASIAGLGEADWTATRAAVQ